MDGAGGFDGIEETKPNNRKRKKYVASKCPLCGLKWHKTNKSKKCLFNPSHKDFDLARKPLNESEDQPAVTTTQQDTTELAADEADAMDSLPFDLDLPGVDIEKDEFHDAGTWTDDDEGNITTIPSNVI